jgi:hypothetical protein
MLFKRSLFCSKKPHNFSPLHLAGRDFKKLSVVVNILPTNKNLHCACPPIMLKLTRQNFSQRHLDTVTMYLGDPFDYTIQTNQPHVRIV